MARNAIYIRSAVISENSNLFNVVVATLPLGKK